MSEEKCPGCSNHCAKDNLQCGRGKEYFNGTKEENTIQEQVIADLRKCGHMLYHNKDLNISSVLINITDDELYQLHELLLKIYMEAK